MPHSNSSNGKPANPRRNAERLRIIVASTPKTGNTWVKHLLAELYGLPFCELPLDPADIRWRELGPRWIAHQHYLPTAELLEAGAQNDVVFVTTVRHPGDTFVSLVHHVRREGVVSDQSSDQEFMLRDAEPYGPCTMEFLRHGFREHLHLSILWQFSGRSHLVRYEDLWFDPLATFTRLAEKIAPMPRARLREAICACEIETMSRTHPARRGFFRKGGIGSWERELPKTFQHVLATSEPFPQQLAALGYALSTGEKSSQRSTEPARLPNPFRTGDRFANGVRVTPLVKRAFFDAPEALSGKWPETLATGHGTFWAWLNQPAAADPHRDRAFPIVTELALAAYRTREDLQSVFPDPFGSSRFGLVEWLLVHGFPSWNLDEPFGLAVLGRAAEAAAGSAPPLRFAPLPTFDDGTPVPFVAVLAYYRAARHVARAWGDPLASGPHAFRTWLTRPSPEPAPRDPAAAPVSNLAHAVYSLRGDVQGAFPDAFGADREGYLQWFAAHARAEYNIPEALIETAAADLSDAVAAESE